MKKYLVILLALVLALTMFTACGGASEEPAEGSDSGSAADGSLDPATIKTFEDVFSVADEENSQYAFTDTVYVYAFPYGDDFYRAEAELTEEESNALWELDFEDPEHDAQTEYAAVPEDYYQKVTRIIADHDIQRRCDFSEYNHASGSYDNHELGYYGFGDQTAADGEPDAEGLYLEIYIEYESGRIIHIETGKSSEIDAVRDLILELSDYHHSLFTQ